MEAIEFLTASNASLDEQVIMLRSVLSRLHSALDRSFPLSLETLTK